MNKHIQNLIPPTISILADNSYRLRQFRTRTILNEESGKKVVYKCAASGKAKPFIKGMVAKERANAAYLKGHFDVHTGILEGDRIKYDYLPHPSLTDRMRLYMREGDFQAAQELLDKYIQKIKALKITYTIPRKFLTLVGNEDNYTCKSDCLCHGLLDLTPKNILIDNERWIVLDNEWSFEFPVPVIFVIFRAIRELFIMLQAEIRKTTSQNIPALGLFAYGLHTYYLPLLWLKYIVTTNTSFQRLIRWEAGFDRYVMGANSGSYGIRIKRSPPLRTCFSVHSETSDSQIRSKIKRFMKSLPGVARLVHFLDQ